jgi:anti-anti-sigma factor
MLTQQTGAQISPFDISLEYHGDTGSLLLSGELDRSHERQLEQEYRRLAQVEAVSKLIVDIRRVTFADRRALELIRALCERARQDGLDLILMRARSELRRELERNGMHQLLPIAYELSDPR